MFDLRHPFFNPLWRRVLTVAVALGWALFELATGSPGWALMFGAVGAWAGYVLLLTWVPVDDERNDDG
ncbi:MAG: DUF3329 domain-containing protein [Hyphomicrobiaceae bacterium]